MPDDAQSLLVAVLSGWDQTTGADTFSGDEVHIEGNNDAWRLLQEGRCRWFRYHISPNYFRQPKRWNLEKPDVILNLISDVDQNPQTLQIAERITAPVLDKVINKPVHIQNTGREAVCRTLQGIPGLVVPRVIRVKNPTLSRIEGRVSAEGFGFPAIARRPGTHSGTVLGVYDTPEGLQAQLESDEPEILLTEFRDFRSPDGLYRKMRFFLIGDHLIFRHLVFSTDWNVHARDRQGLMWDRPDLQQEERGMAEDGGARAMEPLRSALEELQKRLQLDYVGMDCALMPDGRLLIFEVNATMNFFPFLRETRFEYLYASYGRAISAMDQLIHDRAKQALVTI